MPRHCPNARHRCPTILLPLTLWLVALCGLGHAAPNPNASAWDLLLANKPTEAADAFAKNTSNPDPSIAAEAFRGISEAADFRGDMTTACRAFLNAFQKDGNQAMLAGGLLKQLVFARSYSGYQIREGFEVLKPLSRTPGLFAGGFQDHLAHRSLSDGNIGEARALVKDMGCLLNWRFIGPFQNISHSGYNTAYPPEQEVDFSRTYPGSDGNLTTWRMLQSPPTSNWIFTEDHDRSSHGIYYFYCTVVSPSAQDARLAFGASGMFKVFLNGAVVMADSVFRNTGVDAFVQTVHLAKGENALLVKLGHTIIRGDNGQSNFCVRLLDMHYTALRNVAIKASPLAVRQPAGPSPARLRPSPVADSVMSVLESRLKRDARDMDASIQLMRFYNGMEMTDEGQRLAHSVLAAHPKSALWHDLLAESFLRAKKRTEAQVEEKTAYDLSPAHSGAWNAELSRVAESDEPERILRFIAASPKEFQSSLAALLYKIGAYSKKEDRTGIMECIAEMVKNQRTSPVAVKMLAGFYLDQGTSSKAIRLVKTYLTHDRTNDDMWTALAQLYLKKGSVNKAISAIEDGLKYRPANATAYYFLGNLCFMTKQNSRALGYLDQALDARPAYADALNLKGHILRSTGRTADAERAFSDAITYTRDDFNAWDNLRTLKGKPPLDSLAPLPRVADILKASAHWEHRSNEKGAVLSYINDVFYYPSRCSKERTFLLVYISTEKAIDLWKEYTIGYNSYFQVPTIGRALTLKQDGTQVQADVERNQVVFKSLQPGDCIMLEWSLKNYYFGEMARHVYGSQTFQLGYPTWDSRMRLVTPQSDTIAYRIVGDSVDCQTQALGDYRIATFSRPPYKPADDETFEPYSWPTYRHVNYSTFTQWSQIAQWYDNLTAHKQDNSLELSALADSLVAGASTPSEKATRIHRYITSSIRYSFVPFRQSGWIPQAAQEVLATRIGDCKDMASLGKVLFDRAGIASDLVLVNTGERHFTDLMPIGADFNHCILTCELDGVRRFIDFTDNNSPIGCLPRGDQAAVALIVGKEENALITLPLDSASQRPVVRLIRAQIAEDGALRQTVATTRVGTAASGYRASYRYESAQERVTGLHKSLSRDYPGVTVDSFNLQYLDTLNDTVRYTYVFRSTNVATLSGATAIVPVRIPDAIGSDDYPVDEKRHSPVDLTFSEAGISSQSMHLELTHPASWKPISLPTAVNLVSPYGTYRIEFSSKGNTIVCDRTAKFASYKPLDPQEYPKLKEFLGAVAKADDVQLVFFTGK